MQIDWLTVAAQIANFLVLVWLLNHFLYGPITRAMKKREDGINERLSEAGEKRSDAEAEAKRLRDKQDDLDARREDLLQEARDRAQKKREQLEKELQEKADARKKAWADQLVDEREDFLREMRRRAGQHVQEVTRKVMNEFAGADLASELAGRFIEKLRGLDDEELDRLRKTAGERSPEVLIESSVPLPSPVRGHLTKTLHEVIAEDIETEYREDEEIEFGLRLTIAEQVVEWSASTYLDRLETAVSEALDTMESTASGDAA